MTNDEPFEQSEAADAKSEADKMAVLLAAAGIPLTGPEVISVDDVLPILPEVVEAEQPGPKLLKQSRRERRASHRGEGLGTLMARLGALTPPPAPRPAPFVEETERPSFIIPADASDEEAALINAEARLEASLFGSVRLIDQRQEKPA